jgi:hypothetical protein
MTEADETPTASELEQVQKPGPMMLAVEGRGSLPEIDSESIRQRINDRMLAARSPEELVKAGQAYSLDDLAGVPLEVHSVILRKSGFEGEGLDVYVIADAIEGVDGKQIVFTTSAENVVRQLAIAHDRGWLPYKFKVRKADKPTDRGFYPWIVESV